MSQGAQLRRLVLRARLWATAGAALACVVETAWLSLALLLPAAGIAAWSERGDLTATAWRIAVVLAALLVVALRARALWRVAGSTAAASAALARCRRSLGRPPTPDLDRRLRHEIHGALDLVRGYGKPGSEQLRSRYVEDVEGRVLERGVRARRALPALPWARWAVAVVALAIAYGSALRFTTLERGLSLVLAGTDARPAPPPEPVWSSLTLELRYPEHTARPPRTVPNPSGALRVPAGTVVSLSMLPRHTASAAAVVVTHDGTELSSPPAPERVELSADGAGGFTGEFTVRGSGNWTVVTVPDDGADERRSAALPVQLEPDRPPEIDVTPLAPGEQTVRDDESLTVRWQATDDFGVASVELLYQLPDGTTRGLGRKQPPDLPRSWRNHTSWDISGIPIAERSEVLYWLEVRDNDPGLGLDPLPEGPGKPTRSATLRLQVEDEQAEHAANILGLRALRDRAVDMLGARLVTKAFAEDGGGAATRADLARALHAEFGALLTAMAATVDALSVDALTEDRDAETLAAIHRRLLVIHKQEAAQHGELAPGSELAAPEAAVAALAELAPTNLKIVTALEDEIIRLDDMVDGMLIEQLEALVARLEATQRKIVELLEQLQAGDESVRAQLEQLEQRRREDLRRLSEVRAQLREEVEQEFMNMDAFSILEKIASDEQLQAMLQRGEVDRALEQARGELDEVQRMRDQVQERAGAPGAPGPLSEEERRRIALLRELSRLQDEEATLRSSTSELQRAWRDRVSERTAGQSSAEAAERKAAQLQELLEDVNDARLGREARRGLDDAKGALERLRSAAGREGATALELSEAADAALDGIGRALAGSERREAEGKALERAEQRSRALQGELESELPGPEQVLDPAQLEQLEALRERQAGVRERASELSRGELGDLLPPAGRQGMRRADGGMGRSTRGLQQRSPREAIGGQAQAWQGLQDAIDSLRRGAPPPPAGGSGEASTEAERDRSLRDELIDAMREDAPPGFVDPVRRYYEELLR